MGTGSGKSMGISRCCKVDKNILHLFSYTLKMLCVEAFCLDKAALSKQNTIIVIEIIQYFVLQPTFYLHFILKITV